MTSQESLFEQLIQGVLNEGYGVADHFITDEMEKGLKKNLQGYLESGDMMQGGMGQQSGFHKDKTWRSDHIRWLNASDGEKTEIGFLDLLHLFMAYLNKTCFTGLNALECHYSSYESGSFYKKHLDQFAGNTGRKFSIILYLNDNWKRNEGGHLILHRDHDKVRISPDGGKLVFFESKSMWHEVLPASRTRKSVAGWMKSV